MNCPKIKQFDRFRDTCRFKILVGLKDRPAGGERVVSAFHIAAEPPILVVHNLPIAIDDAGQIVRFH